MEKHLVLIRRCLITPTRCILYPPALETSNSFLRANLDNLNHILRVQFVGYALCAYQYHRSKGMGVR